jgi:thioredoxin-dependent peroxiredoxin
MTLSIGDPAPDFTLPTDGGGTVTLSALRGQTVILYFYPKDDTPGCTKEACEFRDALPDFSGINATVLGISRDSVKSHEKFRTKYELPFPLAADLDGEVCGRYGTWVEKSMYGKKYMGIDRATFLIDKEGILRGIWRKVSVTGHVAAVLTAARAT